MFNRIKGGCSNKACHIHYQVYSQRWGWAFLLVDICKECGKPLPVRERLRKGRIREYCGAKCRMKALRKRRKV